MGGGGRVPAGGADRLPGPVRGGRAGRRRERADPRCRQRRVDDRRVARGAGGRRVLVTSSSQEKIDRAKELGAEGGVLYTEEGWAEAAGPVDVVLDSVGSTWRESLKALRRGGRLVVFGGTGGPEVTLDVRALYLNWQSIRGTTMGSRRDFAGLMRMVEGGAWQPGDRQRPPAGGGRGRPRPDEGRRALRQARAHDRLGTRRRLGTVPEGDCPQRNRSKDPSGSDPFRVRPLQGQTLRLRPLQGQTPSGSDPFGVRP